jgi:hypothetical protein
MTQDNSTLDMFQADTEARIAALQAELKALGATVEPTPLVRGTSTSKQGVIKEYMAHYWDAENKAWTANRATVAAAFIKDERLLTMGGAPIDLGRGKAYMGWMPQAVYGVVMPK